MVSNSLLSFFLVFSSSLHLGFSDQSAGDLIQSLTQQTAAVTNGQTSMECMQKLIPCQSFLKSPTNPPATCCSPLKEVLANDTQCLCYYFNDPKVLQSVNVTQKEALELPKACNLNADISICKKEASGPTATSTGSGSISSPNISVADFRTNNPPPPSSATKITHFGAASLIALVFAAY